MKIPEYMKEFEKIKSSFKGKSGIIEVKHAVNFNDDLNGCNCPVSIRVIARDNKGDEMSMFGYRHIFKDRTIEPLDDIGYEHGAVIAYMSDGNPVYGNITRK